MNILYIIGNGFDINLGLKTKYSDFYDYYQSLDCTSVLVKKLKEDISDKLKDWSDLEKSLGEYTKNLTSTEEFDEVIMDIKSNLSNYLIQEEEKIDFTKANKEIFHKYLSFPEQSLLKADINAINTYKDKWKNQNWNVNIITLNYTQIIEKILDSKSKSIGIGKHDAALVLMKGIEHLHGYSNNRMILGVNDKSQIKNLSFHDNEDILETLVKSDCNKAIKHTIDDLCKTQIQNAQLICIFGSSIGETDNLWWELIGDQLKKDIRLIIFTKCEDINPINDYLKARKERALKRLFLSRTKLNDIEKEDVSKKIFIGVNTEMFKDIF